MSPRSSRANRLPGSDELFRSTVEQTERSDRGVADVAELSPGISSGISAVATPVPAERRPSGRERHDEKITVYVSVDELVDLEQARLTLRRDHGLKVDRGRLVRAALAEALGDLETAGPDARVLARLRET